MDSDNERIEDLHLDVALQVFDAFVVGVQLKKASASRIEIGQHLVEGGAVTPHQHGQIGAALLDEIEVLIALPLERGQMAGQAV